MPVASKYKIYSDMIDSNISWLCEVPAHWQLYKFKNIFRIKKRIAGELGFDILSITQRGIKIKDTESGDGQLSMDYSKYQLVFENDFAMNHMDLLTGYVDLSKHEGVTSPDYRVFTLEAKNCDRKYFLYLLQLCYIAKIFYPLGQGAANIGRWRLPTDAFNEFVAPNPPHDEQIRIANFLDHETAKIDTLIEKQQQLIQLLKEKRQAVISHAVTKGLNPNAKMKDSGVEWLGEVPEHWDVKKLKNLVTSPLMYGANEAALEADTQMPRFIRITDVCDDGSLKDDTFRSLNEVLAAPYLLSEGDILLARTGGTVGKSFMYSASWGRCCFAGYLIKASLNQNLVLANWFYQYTQTQYYWEWITSIQIQATLPNVSADKYNGFIIAIPPLEEQKDILAHLKKDVASLDALISKAQTAIGYIQERRTALISAAVTGKIDVRDWRLSKVNQTDKEVMT